eukprot:Filipodium_phascolosomae@DN2043_c0_g1_i2.p1
MQRRILLHPCRISGLVILWLVLCVGGGVSQISSDGKTSGNDTNSTTTEKESDLHTGGNTSKANLVAERIIVMGDIHGDFNTTIAILVEVGVLDASLSWTQPPNTTFIQLGDIVDRGPDSKKLYEFFINLKKDAESKGGSMVFLFGNHEIMNLAQDERYVHPYEFEEYGGTRARRQAWASTDQEPGRFIRENFDLVAKINDNIFVHAGLLPVWAELGIDAINKMGHKALLDKEYSSEHPILGSDGPCWTRSLSLSPPSKACPLVKKTLKLLRARRMFVGRYATLNVLHHV